MAVFIDTSVFLAFESKNHRNRRRARGLMKCASDRRFDVI